ncbi:HAEPLYID family protein [Sinomicrobium sp. M5D2P9]
MEKIKALYLRNVTLLFMTIMVTLITNAQTRDTPLPDKVPHAEPLYLDLVRDLGARKGEKEINVGADFAKIKNYNKYAFLVEYEFAPIHRLGLEVEADFSFFKRAGGNAEVPANKLECLRFSSQYSFLVSTEHQATLAVGYTQIFEFTDFNKYGNNRLITGVAYNPFFIAAKRWGSDFHTLVYTGPVVGQDLADNTTGINWQINTSFHYTIPGTGHFIGIEINKEINRGRLEMTLRPQAKIKLNHRLAVGLVTGFPMNKGPEGFSSFLRVIYEL